MKLFDNFMHWYVKRRLQHISDTIVLLDIKGLIRYHDYMAIQCINCETKARERVLNISLQTASALEGLMKCP